MIRVLIVEDSPTIQTLLRGILSSDPEIRVIGIAANGAEGLRLALALKPDLVTMDIRMPVMDGFEAISRIMQECPVPIVVVSSSVESPDLMITFNAIQAGALDVIEKPHGVNRFNLDEIRERLVTTVKLMADVKVIRRRPPHHLMASTALEVAIRRAGDPPRSGHRGHRRFYRGPAALHTILGALPEDFPLPVVVVQHMAPGFTEGLVHWLAAQCRLHLHVAGDGQNMVGGHVYFAPSCCHLVLRSRDTLGLEQSMPVNHVRPSATVLFESVAFTYGADAMAVLLTGMGEDGAAGLKAIHDRGGLTLAQDQATSVVFGMPKAAIELGAADLILPVGKIATCVLQAAQRKRLWGCTDP